MLKHLSKFRQRAGVTVDDVDSSVDPTSAVKLLTLESVFFLYDGNG